MNSLLGGGKGKEKENQIKESPSLSRIAKTDNQFEGKRNKHPTPEDTAPNKASGLTNPDSFRRCEIERAAETNSPRTEP